MKFNLEKKPGAGNTTNKKEQLKKELAAKKHLIGVVTNADYKARQEKVAAPFGKEFKGGAHDTGKVYKRDKPRRGKDW